MTPGADWGSVSETPSLRTVFRKFVFSVQQETQPTREARGVMIVRGTLFLRNFPGWVLWEQPEPGYHDDHRGLHGDHFGLHGGLCHLCFHLVPLMEIQS